MKRTLIILFLLVSVFSAPADAQPCPEGINHITDCPDEGCGIMRLIPNSTSEKTFDPMIKNPSCEAFGG